MNVSTNITFRTCVFVGLTSDIRSLSRSSIAYNVVFLCSTHGPRMGTNGLRLRARFRFYLSSENGCLIHTHMVRLRIFNHHCTSHSQQLVCSAKWTKSNLNNTIMSRGTVCLHITMLWCQLWKLNVAIKRLKLCLGWIIQVCRLLQAHSARFPFWLLSILWLAVLSLQVRMQCAAFLKGTPQLVFLGFAHIYKSAPLISQLVVDHRHGRTAVQTGMPWGTIAGITDW